MTTIRTALGEGEKERAAIEAMRDPTEAMLAGTHADALFAMQWRKAIDAALAQGRERE